MHVLQFLSKVLGALLHQAWKCLPLKTRLSQINSGIRGLRCNFFRWIRDEDLIEFVGMFGLVCGDDGEPSQYLPDWVCRHVWSGLWGWPRASPVGLPDWVCRHVWSGLWGWPRASPVLTWLSLSACLVWSVGLTESLSSTYLTKFVGMFGLVCGADREPRQYLPDWVCRHVWSGLWGWPRASPVVAAVRPYRAATAPHFPSDEGGKTSVERDPCRLELDTWKMLIN